MELSTTRSLWSPTMFSQEVIDCATKEIEKFLKLPASHIQHRVGVVRVMTSINFNYGHYIMIPIRVEFDDDFLAFDAEQKQFTLFHEQGHIQAYRKRLPGHV